MLTYIKKNDKICLRFTPYLDTYPFTQSGQEKYRMYDLDSVKLNLIDNIQASGLSLLINL